MGRDLNVGYPGRAATPLSAGSGVVSNATAAATLAKTNEQVVYCTGFQITAGGATAAANVTATLTGVLGGTRSFVFGVPVGAGVPATPLVVQFEPPLPAADENTDIVLSLPALGAGNTHAAVMLQGFKV